ncbi:hypothetical protein BN2475_450009 [Paraburkholderia ribeironis]|uniref:DDE domain-containing protein n=1 Tax=Paraburkholderia ribeironis TaxID=1247936 RepID=A0A1N7S8J6_9BURK|nr:hypothetical protein BN2475_450009 [Paraburkholderia ribeironis]
MSTRVTVGINVFITLSIVRVVCHLIADRLTATEPDHRYIKSRTDVTLGFKRFRSAAITLSDIELMHRIRKGQFNSRSSVSKILLRPPSGTLSCLPNKTSFIRTRLFQTPICTRPSSIT